MPFYKVTEVRQTVATKTIDAATELHVGIFGDYASSCGGPGFKYCHVNVDILLLSSVTPSWWGRDFPRLSTPVMGLTQPPKQWVPEVKRAGRGFDHLCFLASRLKKE